MIRRWPLHSLQQQARSKRSKSKQSSFWGYNESKQNSLYKAHSLAAPWVGYPYFTSENHLPPPRLTNRAF